MLTLFRILDDLTSLRISDELNLLRISDALNLLSISDNKEENRQETKESIVGVDRIR